MKLALARHWRWFVVAAIPLDLAIMTIAYLSGDFTTAIAIFPVRWLVLAGGVFAIRWAQQAGILPGFEWRACMYLVFGFTAAGLVAAALSGFSA